MGSEMCIRDRSHFAVFRNFTLLLCDTSCIHRILEHFLHKVKRITDIKIFAEKCPIYGIVYIFHHHELAALSMKNCKMISLSLSLSLSLSSLVKEKIEVQNKRKRGKLGDNKPSILLSEISGQ